MTLQDLGSIGEFLAAIATIATLAYLAIQIRQNTRVLRGTFHDSHVNRIQAWQIAIASDSELSSIWFRVHRGDEVTEQERQRLGHLRIYFLAGTEALYHQYMRGNIDPEVWEAQLTRIRVALAQAEFRHWWREKRDFAHTESFEALMDSEIKAIEQGQGGGSRLDA